MLAIRLQLQMLNRLSPFNSRSLRYAFSTFLSDGAQQAFIAHTAIHIIRYFKIDSYLGDTRSIRNLILDRAYFKSILINFIRPTNRNRLRREDITSEWIDSTFKEENYQAVLQGFQLHRGAPYNKQIWPQDRMFQQSINGRIILFPVSTTSEHYNRLAEGHNGILSGLKGTGKSFSFFTYSYLSSFKAKYLASKQVDKLNELLHYGRPSDWQVVTQICYISLKDELKYATYYLRIAKQFDYLYPFDQIEKDFEQNELKQEQEKKKNQMQNQKMKKNKIYIEPQSKTQTQQERNQRKAKKKFLFMLQNLQKKQQEYGIKIFCVIDEANLIFRLITKIEAYISKYGVTSNWKQTKQFKILAFYDSLFTIILEHPKYSFRHIILNSSQDLALQNAIGGDYNNSPLLLQIPFVKKACMNRNFGEPQGTGYCQIIVRDQGKVELYNIFWFEIVKFVTKRRILGGDQDIYKELESKLTVHRAIFQNQFNISKDGQFRMIQDWKNEVQHLSIRQYMNSIRIQKQYSFYCPYDNVFLTQHPNEKQIALFRRDLRKLKQNIEQKRIKQIVKSITNYIYKSTSIKDCTKRKKYLNRIFDQAKSYCSDNTAQKNSNISFSYLSKMGLSVLQQKAMAESLIIGFFEKEILKFGMSPQNLVQLIGFALSDRRFNISVARTIKDLFIGPKQKEIGKYLDKVSLPIFVDGHFNLNYIEYQRKGEENLSSEEPIGKQTQLSVGETFPIICIIGRNHICFDNFDSLLKLADENVENHEYAGGFLAQLIYDKDDSQRQMNDQNVDKNESKLSCFVPLESNLPFDNMVFKKLKSAQESKNALYDMILYHWTMKKLPLNYQNGYKRSVTKFLTKTQIKGDIKCKLLFVAPDFLLQEHFDSQKGDRILLNQTNQNQTLSFKSNLSNSYSSFSFTNTIQGISYQRNVTIGLASFDENSPFQLDNNSPNTDLIDFVTQCYKQIKAKENQLQPK